MTKQERKKLEEEVNPEAQDEVTADTEEVAEAIEETEEQDAEKLATELADLNQRFLRVAADFENYKRRTMQEKEDLIKYSNAKIMGELLPILDAFQIALKNPGECQEAQNVIKGVEMLYRQLMQALEQAGMTKIETVGQPFDPKLHEAIMQVDDDSVPEDTVVEELRAGYMLNERVIRPSMVKVSK